MRKVFLPLLLLLCACNAGSKTGISGVNSVSADTAKATNQYQSEIDICDKIANEKLNNPEYFTTIGMNRAISEQTECYKSIAYKIIDQDYTENADEMKETMNNYIKSSGQLTAQILRPDSCYPNCGSIVSLNASSSSLEHATKYLDMLINPSKYWGQY